MIIKAKVICGSTALSRGKPDDFQCTLEVSGKDLHHNNIPALLEATPDLIQACRALLRLHYDTGNPSLAGLEACNMAEATLAKATSQQVWMRRTKSV